MDNSPSGSTFQGDLSQGRSSESLDFGRQRLSKQGHRHTRHELEDETNPTSPGRSQRILAYLFFFILGSCNLLPWNALLVSTTYFGLRLTGNRFEFSYMNWITVVFTIANAAFIFCATFIQPNKHSTMRIFMSLFLITSLSIILLISTQFKKLDSNLFFEFLILVSFSEALGSSYLQASVIGLSSWFGSKYLQAILSGQGAIGALVSVLQLLATVKELGPSKSHSNPQDTPQHIRQSSFTFYALCTTFCLATLICFGILLRLPIYKMAMDHKRSAFKLDKSVEFNEDSVERPLLSPIVGDPLTERLPVGLFPTQAKPKLTVVERKIRLLGLSIFYNFFITLAVFPSLTGFILSANDPHHTHVGDLSIPTTTSSRSGFFENWYRPILFIPIHFVIFNLGDWLGRALPQILPRFSEALVQRRKVLYLTSIMRTIFIPLFLLCNIDHSSIVIFKSDLIYMFILSSFSVSNGYLSTLIMISGITEPSLEPNEVDLAATCLSFYLTTGLAAGSLISFAVKAIVSNF